VQLGGPEDDGVRRVFMGHTPKTPSFSTGRRHYSKSGKRVRFTKGLTSPTSESRPIKRRRAGDDKSVTQLEY